MSTKLPQRKPDKRMLEVLFLKAKRSHPDNLILIHSGNEVDDFTIPAGDYDNFLRAMNMVYDRVGPKAQVFAVSGVSEAQAKAFHREQAHNDDLEAAIEALGGFGAFQRVCAPCAFGRRHHH